MSHTLLLDTSPKKKKIFNVQRQRRRHSIHVFQVAFWCLLVLNHLNTQNDRT